jgi:hypothetical protein
MEMSVLVHQTPREEIRESGEQIEGLEAGSLFCVGCGFAFSIAAVDALPTCPNCRGSRFRRASLFDQPTIAGGAIEVAEEAPDWLDVFRSRLDQPGSYLAYEDAEGDAVLFALEAGWTRIGRSAAADIRFDDATVSRRHALVVLTDDGEVRALDDRSLNGLFVNGERVEWAALGDGDELEIGRYRLYLIEA